MKQFKELEKDIPIEYINQTDNVQNKENRIVVYKKYKDGIESKWYNKTTDTTTQSVMCISLTYNKYNETVRCVVSEAPPDLSSLINVFDDPDNEYHESGYWKEIIAYTYKYNPNTGCINGWSLNKLYNKLENEHITNPFAKKTITIINSIRSCIVKFIIRILRQILYALPYKEKWDNGEYKVNSLSLTMKEAINNARNRITSYNVKHDNNTTDNVFKAKSLDTSLGLSVMTVIAFITFMMGYIPIQLVTYNMTVPSIMIVDPDWTFIQVIFAVWLAIVYVLSYLLVYPIAHWLHKYVQY